MQRLPTYFVSHGGGPWPWMRDMTGGRYDRLEASLQAMAQAHHGQVRAILRNDDAALEVSRRCLPTLRERLKHL